MALETQLRKKTEENEVNKISLQQAEANMSEQRSSDSFTSVGFSSPLSKDEFEKGQILACLPDDNQYIIEKFQVIETSSEIEFQFVVEGRANVRSKEELSRFLEEFANINGSSYNIRSGKADRKGKNTVIYGYRKCIMNVVHEESKNFRRNGLQRKCESDLRFRLEKEPEIFAHDRNITKKRKKMVADYPLYFSINFAHNHQLKRHEYSRFGAVSQDTRARS